MGRPISLSDFGLSDVHATLPCKYIAGGLRKRDCASASQGDRARETAQERLPGVSQGDCASASQGVGSVLVSDFVSDLVSDFVSDLGFRRHQANTFVHVTVSSLCGIA